MYVNMDYRTYKNRVLSWPIREATPPPWHTQKSAIFVIMDCNTKSL